jgi:hypothetical protein
MTLGQTQIAVGGGRTVKLSDIAKVSDLYAEQRSRLGDERPPGAELRLPARQGRVGRVGLRRRKEKLAAAREAQPEGPFPAALQPSRNTPSSNITRRWRHDRGRVLAVSSCSCSCATGARPAISALAIPLSAIPTFWFMDLLGFTLNQMTLLALSLVAGVLVDDAIVEIENIVRHMRMGKSAYQASIDAADEIGLAVLATTMSIVAVFLPVGLMPGISGQFFKNFGLTVVASVLMSLAVARLITPMIAAYFLKAQGQAKHGEGRMMDAYMACCAGRCGIAGRRCRRRRVAGADHRACSPRLPMTFQPTRTRTSRHRHDRDGARHHARETERVVAQRRRSCRSSPTSRTVYSRAFVGNGRVTRSSSSRTSAREEHEFERALAPSCSRSPMRGSTSARSNGWGGSGRDLTITLGGDDPVCSPRPRSSSSSRWALPEARRAAHRGRPATARNRHQAAASIWPPISA